MGISLNSNKFQGYNLMGISLNSNKFQGYKYIVFLLFRQTRQGEIILTLHPSAELGIRKGNIIVSIYCFVFSCSLFSSYNNTVANFILLGLSKNLQVVVNCQI